MMKMKTISIWCCLILMLTSFSFIQPVSAAANFIDHFEGVDEQDIDSYDSNYHTSIPSGASIKIDSFQYFDGLHSARIYLANILHVAHVYRQLQTKDTGSFKFAIYMGMEDAISGEIQLRDPDRTNILIDIKFMHSTQYPHEILYLDGSTWTDSGLSWSEKTWYTVQINFVYAPPFGTYSATITGGGYDDTVICDNARYYQEQRYVGSFYVYSYTDNNPLLLSDGNSITSSHPCESGIAYGCMWFDYVNYGASIGSYVVSLYDNPSDKGNITFDGVEYPHGTILAKTIADYPISPNPVAGYTFDSWTTSGKVTILGATATVLGDGDITADFIQTPTHTLTFNDNPANGGNITFDGTTYTNGQTESVEVGSYSISADPASGYTFYAWVLGSYPCTIIGNTIDVYGDCTIQADFSKTPPSSYAITFNDDPSIGGSILFDVTEYSDGESDNYVAGSYAIEPTPASGYSFDSWQTTGGITIHNIYRNIYTAEVTDTGTITAVYTLQANQILFIINPSGTGTITFNGTVYSNGGSDSYPSDTYAISASAISGYKFSSWSHTGAVDISGGYATISGTGSITANFVRSGGGGGGGGGGTSIPSSSPIEIVAAILILVPIVILLNRNKSGISRASKNVKRAS